MSVASRLQYGSLFGEEVGKIARTVPTVEAFLSAAGGANIPTLVHNLIHEVFMRRVLLAMMVLIPTAASAEMFEHNGSLMIVNYDWNDIRYDTPSDRMDGLVRPGDPAFTGHIERRGDIDGTAYVYKKGCDFVFYKMSGRYDPSIPGYVLTGAAPVREKKGCRVTGYTAKSPNARLVFVDVAEKEKREQDDYAESLAETESDPNWMKGFNDPTKKK